MKYAFVHRSDAEALLDLLPGGQSGPKSHKTQRGDPLTEGWLFFTPPDGIPAAAGNVCGHAECVPYYIDEDFNRRERSGDDGNPLSITVLNVFSTAIGGNRFITAKKIFGKIVADAEDC